MAFIKEQVNNFLERLLSTIDISEFAYETAKERYQQVGFFLCRDKSSVSTYAPRIYPQGSFLLGTVIRPTTEEEDYDIDLVCQLKIDRKDISQQDFKKLVGEEIKKYVERLNLEPVHEGRRCWTIKYSGDLIFHLDILPSSDNQITLEERKTEPQTRPEIHAIAITDNTLPNYSSVDENWPTSNPRGYYHWFQGRMKAQFEFRRKQIAEHLKISVEDVPEHLVKTPLQRVVQLLKRHRDIKYGDYEFKPISIIISTLAANAYENEEQVLDALLNIVSKMQKLVTKLEDGSYLVENPVNSAENFADRWEGNVQFSQTFFSWLEDIQDNLIATLKSDRLEFTAEALKDSIGELAIKKALLITPPGEIGLRKVSLTKRNEKEEAEITSNLFCKTIKLHCKATIEEVQAALGQDTESYGLIMDESKNPLALVRPEELKRWIEYSIDKKQPALNFSYTLAEYVTAVFEKEEQTLFKLKRILQEHKAIVVQVENGTYGVLNGSGWDVFLKSLGSITLSREFLIKLNEST